MLEDINDSSVVVNAIESSIAKAQEGPRKVIAKNKQTIAIAGVAQATVSRATLTK